MTITSDPKTITITYLKPSSCSETLLSDTIDVMQGVTDWQVVNTVGESINLAFLTDYYAESQTDTTLCGDRTFTFTLTAAVDGNPIGTVIGTDMLTVSGTAPSLTLDFVPSLTTNRYFAWPMKLVVTLAANPSQLMVHEYFFTLTINCATDITTTITTAMASSTVTHTIL